LAGSRCGRGGPAPACSRRNRCQKRFSLVSIFLKKGIVDTEVISASAMRFQLRRCDFSFGDAISASAMQFQLRRCNFSFGDAISASAMLFQLRRCYFSFGDAIFAAFGYAMHYITTYVLNPAQPLKIAPPKLC
jgi:hypothetical protein